MPSFKKRPNQLELERIVVYKKGKIIDDSYYIVEISYNLRGLFISLFSVESEKSNLVLEITDQSKKERMMRQFGNDYDQLACHLSIVGDCVKVIKPRSQELPVWRLWYTHHRRSD